MKLSNFIRNAIYALSSVCLVNTELNSPETSNVTETEITIPPPTGKGHHNPGTADQIEDDLYGTDERLHSNEFDFHKAALEGTEKSISDSNLLPTGQKHQNPGTADQIEDDSYGTDKRTYSDEFDFHKAALEGTDRSVVDSKFVEEEFSESHGSVEEDNEETDFTTSEENSHSVDSMEGPDSDESEAPKKAAGEMGHGVGDLSKVEEEFWDNFKKGTGGHWIELRHFTPTEIVNICKSIYTDENGPETLAAYYQASQRLREFKVRLSDEQIEDLETDVLECSIVTIEDERENFKNEILYVAEGSSPTNVFKLKKSSHSPEDTLEVYGRTNVVY